MADKQPVNATLVRAGDGRQDAELIADGIYLSRDVSNCYRIVTQAGDVMINTGFPPNGEENLRRFSAISTQPVTTIVFTQSHPDHIGGWRWFRSDATETIAQANFDHVYGYFEQLRPTMTRRSRHLWKRDIKETLQEFVRPKIDTYVDKHHAFSVGEKRFELFSVPGGETLDSLIVWLPDERVLFSGNLTGPIFGHVPNLYTLRGDKIRYVQWYLDGVKKLIDLAPELLITGHGEPLRGAEVIHQELTQIYDAVNSVKEQTFAGMNAGMSLWQLMEDVKLPHGSTVGQGHGKVPWMVRAIWEEHMGWFRFESTTELYSVPVRDVYTDLAKLVDREQLLEQASGFLQQNDFEKAIHLAEIQLSYDARDQQALVILRQATVGLLERSGRENFSEVRWLESEILRTDEKIKEAGR